MKASQRNNPAPGPTRAALCLAAALAALAAPAATCDEGMLPLRPFPPAAVPEVPAAEDRPFLILGGELSERLGAAPMGKERAGLAPKGFLAFGLRSDHLALVANLSANTDAAYGPALADLPSGNLGQIYFLMEEGGLRWKGGALAFSAGRFRHYDVVETPYSLFVNSRGIPATLMSLAYDDGFFFYESRWLGLTRASTMKTDAWGVPGLAYTGTGFPDRGANLKVYGFRFANGMRFGFQDAAVYSTRYFEPEYFLNPIPQYFIQYALATGGRPWATEQDDGNMIGAFWDWRRDDRLSFTAQVLMDDFGFGGLFGTVANPNQVAFSLGGRIETGVGAFSLYAAGATAYTFEPAPVLSNTDQQAMVSYGYTYYPDTRFDYVRDNATFDPAAMTIEENSIGYLYGENNLALQALWSGRAGGFELLGSLEFRLMGQNSPANPWHDGIDQWDLPSGTRWLDDPVLEKRIQASFKAETTRGSWRIWSQLTAGVAFDALALSAPTGLPAGSWSRLDTDVWIYRPVAGNTVPIFKISLGASYEWRL